MDGKVIGILGGGQLGRMLAAAASLLNIQVVILDEGHAPAKQIVYPSDSRLNHIDGSFKEPKKILELAKQVDVLTVEIEHVDVDALQAAQRDKGVVIHPSPSSIRIIQDKYQQKVHLSANGISVADFLQVASTEEDIRRATDSLGLPLMLKSRTFAYDGRGNFLLSNLQEIPDAIRTLGNRPLYAERCIQFEREVAVMVVRSASGEMLAYPPAETIHKENICHLVFAPCRSRDPTLLARAEALAVDVVRTFEGAGVFGVEMFLMGDGSLLVNEVAPRPHNSGHYTIEACETSQFENHVRAILSLPLGRTTVKVPAVAMLNIIGASSDMSQITAFVKLALAVPGVSVHLYGKTECRKGRKMGHVTIVGDSDAQVRERLRPLLQALPSGTTTEELELYSERAITVCSERSHHHPLVGIIMGSDSDLPVMRGAALALDHFKIPYELTIVSAHRTPKRLVEYAHSADARGLKVIITGAGGAAHLPGMVASMTSLPVIGVPIKTNALNGVDSLYSIVQMPRGIPVATTAINGAENAGLLAARILSVAMPELLSAMNDYRSALEMEVIAKVDKLDEVGWVKYEVKK